MAFAKVAQPTVIWGRTQHSAPPPTISMHRIANMVGLSLYIDCEIVKLTHLSTYFYKETKCFNHKFLFTGFQEQVAPLS